MKDDSQRAKYQKSLAKHGTTPQALKWNSFSSAASRYREIADATDYAGAKILDVGCGFGDIIPFLLAKTDNFDYTGLDVVPEFIAEAEKRYPDFDFMIGDYMHESYRLEADFIICSGAFNYKSDNPVELRKEVITRMFNQAERGIIFTMAGHSPQPAAEAKSKLYYADALEILRFCLELSPKVIFKQHYHERDFMMAVFK